MSVSGSCSFILKTVEELRLFDVSRSPSPLSVASTSATPEPKSVSNAGVSNADVINPAVSSVVAVAKSQIDSCNQEVKSPPKSISQPIPKSPPRKSAVLAKQYEHSDPSESENCRPRPGEKGWTQEFIRRVNEIVYEDSGQKAREYIPPNIPVEIPQDDEGDEEKVEDGKISQKLYDKIFPPNLQTSGYIILLAEGQ